ncbi:MAG: flagellar export protein FliJ [Eubacterium sp.]|nr:flagellar export protein FliJ [Eubacterium sp.]
MARFIFPMQNLLTMKEKLEDQEKNNYSRANMVLQEAREELERLVDRQTRAEDRLRLQIAQEMDVLTIRRMEDDIEIIKTYVMQQKLVVAQREKELHEIRIRLAQAMKERKTFEKLRERAYLEFIEEENRKEQKEVDEMISYRYGNGQF